MATGLQNYDDISAPDSDYPDGNIKNDTGANDGTPVDKTVYADMHQTLAKFLRLASITPSGVPDNEYSGFQYVEAMNAIFGDGRNLMVLDTTAVGNVAEARYGTKVVFLKTAGAGNFITMKRSSGFFFSKVIIQNYSYHSVQLFDFDTANINSVAPPYTMDSRSCIQFTLNTATNNWELTDRYAMT